MEGPLATRSDYVEWAHDSLTELGYRRVFDLLPRPPEDGEWGEILPDLTGDASIEILCQYRPDGNADPDEPTNRYPGNGDYRSQAGRVLFDRAKGK